MQKYWKAHFVDTALSLNFVRTIFPPKIQMLTNLSYQNV